MKRFVLAVLTLAAFVPALPAQIVGANFYFNSVEQYNLNGSGFQGTINAPFTNNVNGPSGVTVGPDSNIYFSGKGSTAADNAIFKYNVTTGAVTTFISPAQLTAVTGGTPYGPAALRFGPDGNLYVARSVGQQAGPGTGAVDRFTAAGAFDVTVASNLYQPTGLHVSGTSLFVSNLLGQNLQGHGDIVRINNFTGGVPTVSPFIAADSGGLENPTGITFGPDGFFYVADVSYPGTGTGVRRYNAAGLPVNASGLPTADNLIIALPFQFTSDVLFTGGKLVVANLGNPQAVNNPGSIQAYNTTSFALETTLTNSFGYGSLAVNTTPFPVPEPALLLGGVLLGALALRRRVV